MGDRIAKISVSTDLILRALAFPDGTTIQACVGERAALGIIDLYVENNALPKVVAGDAIPCLCPVFTADYENRPATWITCNWNLPPEEDGVSG